jgi:hypothetical protein
MQKSTKRKKTEQTENQQTADRPSASDLAEISREPSHEEIEQRAYEIYLTREGAHGYDWDDWLQAERELKQAQTINTD